MLCGTWCWNLACRVALGSWSYYCWTQALLDALGAPSKQMGFSPTPHPWPHMFYSTSVTNELVQTLSQSQGTSPGLSASSHPQNFVLAEAWIIRPATDLRPPFFYSFLPFLGWRYLWMTPQANPEEEDEKKESSKNQKNWCLDRYAINQDGCLDSPIGLRAIYLSSPTLVAYKHQSHHDMQSKPAFCGIDSCLQVIFIICMVHYEGATYAPPLSPNNFILPWCTSTLLPGHSQRNVVWF